MSTCPDTALYWHSCVLWHASRQYFDIASQDYADTAWVGLQASADDRLAVEYIMGDAEDVPLEEASVDREALIPS